MPKPIHWCASGKASVSSGRACRPSALATETRPSPREPSPRLRARRSRRGDGVALDAGGQWQRRACVATAGEAVAPLPVLVEDVAVAQVGDAGAADLSQARERRAVAADAEQHVDPVAALLERRAVVRRAQADQPAQRAPPTVAGRLGHVAGAARDEAAHAVPDDRQLLDGQRPGRDERLEERAQFAPVGGDVQAAVVVQPQRRVAEIAREGGSVLMAEPPPLPVVHARAVDQDDELGRRLGEDGPQRGRLERQLVAVVPQSHGDGERIAGRGEVVAEDAVEHGQHRLPLGAGDAVAEQRPELREGDVDARAHEVRHPADGLVDHPGHDARRTLERAAEDGGTAADGAVHRLDEVGDALGRLDGQPARAAQIVDVAARPLRHGPMVTQSASAVGTYSTTRALARSHRRDLGRHQARMRRALDANQPGM